MDQIIEPACGACGLAVERADKLRRPGEIPEQIYTRLRDYPLVIADVTGGNPNVFYELGLRHAVGLPCIQIGEKGRLPFDVQAIRTTFFRRTEPGMISARKELQELIQSALAGEYDPVSSTRILRAAPGAVPNSAVAIATAPHEIVDDVEQPGFVDFLAEGEAALPVLGEILTASAAQLEVINQCTTEATAKNSRATSFGARLAIVKEYASKLDLPARELDDLSARYAESFDSVTRANDYLIGRAEEEPTIYNEAPDFFRNLKTLAEATLQSAESTQGFIGALRENATMAKDLRPPARMIEHALNRYVAAAEVGKGWLRRIEAIEAGLEDEPPHA